VSRPGICVGWSLGGRHAVTGPTRPLSGRFQSCFKMFRTPLTAICRLPRVEIVDNRRKEAKRFEASAERWSRRSRADRGCLRQHDQQRQRRGLHQLGTVSPLRDLEEACGSRSGWLGGPRSPLLSGTSTRYSSAMPGLLAVRCRPQHHPWHDLARSFTAREGMRFVVPRHCGERIPHRREDRLWGHLTYRALDQGHGFGTGWCRWGLELQSWRLWREAAAAARHRVKHR
jgi:hypothetical protein